MGDYVSGAKGGARGLTVGGNYVGGVGLGVGA